MTPDFSSLSGKNILITGGTGFVGKSLLDVFNRLNNPPNIFLISRGKLSIDQSLWANLNIHLIQKDVMDLRPSDFNFIVDYFIHAATSTNPLYSTNLEYLEQTIYLGTKIILDLCKFLKPQGFVYLSSGAVYGLERYDDEKIPETDLGAPAVSDLSQMYGHFKRLAETFCSHFYHETKIPTSVARCFTFCGNNLDRNGPFALMDFLRSLKADNTITVKGTGKAVRSYMDQDDMANWLIQLMIQNKAFDILNIGSDQAISILDLAHKVGKNYPESKVHLVPENSTNMRSNFYVPCTKKAQTKYGLTLKYGLEASLKRIH